MHRANVQDVVREFVREIPDYITPGPANVQADDAAITGGDAAGQNPANDLLRRHFRDTSCNEEYGYFLNLALFRRRGTETRAALLLTQN
ncbi:MAG: hypothetical protein H8F28_03480 [Fibrella sp.]|nr:hypothetical protein [Armatimonadota bacterium]